ncbi:MAG: hypothetical protein ACXQS3_07095 [Candidatus Methanofastidiosia archaeon]
MIFDKIFGKKKKEHAPLEKKVLKISDIPQWAKNEKNTIEQEILEHSLQYIDPINKSFSTLNNYILELNDKELEEEVIKRLENITISSKKSFCENMKIILNKWKYIIPETYSDLTAYISRIESTLLSINKAQITHGKYLGIVFETDLKKIGKELKIIVTSHDMIKNIVSKNKEKWEMLCSIESIFEEIIEIEKYLSQVRKIDLQEDMEKLESQLSSLKIEKKKFLLSQEYGKYKSMQERIATLEKQEHELNLELYSVFATIKRVLKKYKKMVDDKKYTLTQEQIEFIEGLMDRPVKTLNGDTDELDLTKNFATHLLYMLKNGNIQEKKGKLDKAQDVAMRIINGELDELKQQYSSTFSELVSIKKKYKEINLDKLDSINKKQEKILAKIKHIQDELENIEKESLEMKDKKKQIISKLKDKVNEINPEISLDF